MATKLWLMALLIALPVVSAAQVDLMKALEHVQKAPKALKKLDPPCPACAAEQAKKKKAKRSPIPFFNQPINMAITLTGPFPQVTSANPQPGTLSYEGEAGTETLPVTYEARGGRRKGMCASFPPFKINLQKDNKGSLFKHSDRDLKFVTQCAEPQTAAATELVLAEYTAYRLLEAAEISSFLVQLVKTTYRNPATHFETTGPGFIIENLKDATARLQKLGRVPTGKASNVEQELAEYFLLNTDYGYIKGEERGTNVRLAHDAAAKPKEGLAMAYDFDDTELVAADYGNIEKSYASDEQRIREIIHSEPELGRAVLTRLIANTGKMNQAIDTSPIQASTKTRFHKRVDHFVAAAQKIVGKP